MTILLTPDQQSTLWNFSETILTENNEKYFSFPFFLKDCGEGKFERLTYEQLPFNVKELILKQRGII